MNIDKWIYSLKFELIFYQPVINSLILFLPPDLSYYNLRFESYVFKTRFTNNALYSFRICDLEVGENEWKLYAMD